MSITRPSWLAGKIVTRPATVNTESVHRASNGQLLTWVASASGELQQAASEELSRRVVGLGQ